MTPNEIMLSLDEYIQGTQRKLKGFMQTFKEDLLLFKAREDLLYGEEQLEKLLEKVEKRRQECFDLLDFVSGHLQEREQEDFGENKNIQDGFLKAIYSQVESSTNLMRKEHGQLKFKLSSLARKL